MIGSLQGKVIRIDGMTVLIEVSGIGYEVEMPVTSLREISVNDDVFIFIHHVVREDASLLYGFSDIGSRTLFRELIKANGIGPKMALAILSALTVDDFIKALSLSDVHALTSIPGVGKKTAERIIVEFKDKIDKLNLSNTTTTLPQNSDTNVSPVANMFALQEAISALMGLGYKENIACEYAKSVYVDGMDTKDIIVKALALVKR